MKKKNLNILYFKTHNKLSINELGKIGFDA